MRSFLTYALLGVSSLGLLSLAPATAMAQGPRSATLSTYAYPHSPGVYTPSMTNSYYPQPNSGATVRYYPYTVGPSYYYPGPPIYTDSVYTRFTSPTRDYYSGAYSYYYSPGPFNYFPGSTDYFGSPRYWNYYYPGY